MFRFVLVAVVGLAAAATASAAPATALFEGLSHDFGTVSRGPMLTYAFPLANNTRAHVIIRGVRTSCGCTTARPLSTDLAPGQSSAIVVTMNTTRFQGSKTVTIFVRFSRPRNEEVRLQVQATSVTDLLIITPDTLDFGRVDRSALPSVSATVSLPPGSQWEVTGVSCDSNYVQPVIQRLPGESPEAGYRLTVTLRGDVPSGKWFTDVWLVTDNPATPRVRVPLTMEIQ